MTQKFRIGFTGTRKGMTNKQQLAVKQRIQELQKDDRTLEGHHGDAIGADRQFHEICQEFGIPVVIHPPLSDKERAFCPGAIDVRPPLDFKAQSQAIANITQILIAAPEGFKERVRGSGTWTTVRYSRKQGQTIVICYPDGVSEEEVEE